MYEYRGVIHLHTTHSDGTATHAQLARIASDAGLDFLVATDHNVLISQAEGWYGDVLVLVGQEVHDVSNAAKENHLLVFGTSQDVSMYAPNPQALIDVINSRGGFSFIAHPFETATMFSGEPEIPWTDWSVNGYAGLEIWNYMSEFKARVPNLALGLFLTYFPQAGMIGPFRETLAQWDELLDHRRVAGIGGADAHGARFRRGPLEREVLPYEFLFRALTTHVLTDGPLTGDLGHDRTLVYQALRNGRSFLAYDLLGSARGFRFTGRTVRHKVPHEVPNEVPTGGVIALDGEVELEVVSPLPAELRLIHRGHVVARAKGRRLRFTAKRAGAYRVEAYRRRLFCRRGWVFTNPIYVS